jgi:hypothetical protein
VGVVFCSNGGRHRDPVVRHPPICGAATRTVVTAGRILWRKRRDPSILDREPAALRPRPESAISPHLATGGDKGVTVRTFEAIIRSVEWKRKAALPCASFGHACLAPQDPRGPIGLDTSRRNQRGSYENAFHLRAPRIGILSQSSITGRRESSVPPCRSRRKTGCQRCQANRPLAATVASLLCRKG